jgi:ABC-type branched-subunit amino acid transport system ATPase component
VKERIDQLWGQALDQAVPETYSQLSHSQVLKVKQVFAQLIVAECLKIAKNREDEFESAGLLDESNAVGNVAYRIARQFGVKE